MSALNVSSKVMALMLRVARMASLSAMEVSSLELGTWAHSHDTAAAAQHSPWRRG